MTGFSNIGRAEGLAGIGANGAPEGDLTGSYPNPLVVGMWDRPIDPRIPLEGDSLIFTMGEWVPTPSPAAVTFFQGPWDANTNTPNLLTYPGLTDGYVWIVTVPGNTLLGGIGNWHLGDYALYSGGTWYKLSNSAFGWGLSGNTGTQANVNYIGTADDQDLVVRTFDSEVMRIYSGGGANLSGSLSVGGNVTVGGSTLSTTNSTFNLINTVASVINFAGAANTLNIGKSSGTNNVSGATKLPQGLSGSLTKLSNGTSYMIAGTGMIILSSSNGPVTLSVNDSVFAALTGSVFTGPVSFNAGLSGSLTKLTDGTSAFIGGTGILVSSASNGAVTFTMSNTGSAGTYGGAASVPVFTADAQGRVTAVTPTAIQIAESQVTNLLTDLTASANATSALSSSLASEKANKITTISAGTGLVGGGDLSTDRTISLGNTGSAGTYGSASSVPVLTTDAQGRVTLVSPTSIQISESQVTNLLTDLTSSYNSVTNLSSSLASQKADKITTISAGTGLTGGGDLSTNRTISLGNTGSAGTYGSASSVPVFTTDAQGRVTLVAPTSIQITESQVTNLLTDLTASANSLASVSSSLASEKANKTTSINAGLGLTGGGNLSADRTLAINNSVVATISGSTFTGAVIFNAGLSGSHTKLVDGTSAFIAGNNINITSASNGAVTTAFSAAGTPVNGDFLTYNGTTWVTTSPVQASAASYQSVVASEAIAAGDVCYIVNSAGAGTSPTVARAQANSLTTIHGVIGFATASIAKNALGAVQTYGQLAGPVDTHTFGQGDPIFVSPTTPGGVTNVKPSGPNYAFQMGVVTRQGQPQNATTGIVFISPMSQNDTQNLSDLVFTTPTDHDGMMYDPATSTWKNQQPLWIPETQTAVTLNAGSTITAANFAGVVYLPIKTQGGANIVLNATTPIASLTKTAQDYGRELWLHNVDNNRTITIPKGANVLLTGSVNLTISASTIVKFLWTGIGGNGSWIQTGPATTIG